MPVVSDTHKDFYSEFFRGGSKIEQEAAGNFHFARVNVVGTDNEVVPAGIPVVAASATTMVPYVAQDISAVTASPLPDESPVAWIVGSKEGKGTVGMDGGNITLASGAGTEVTVMFRGDIIVNEDGINWGASNTAQKAAFRVASEKQRIAINASATTVDPAFANNA